MIRLLHVYGRAYNRATVPGMSNATHEPAREARTDGEAAHALRATHEPLILCVDTATDARSVAVARAARVIAKVREAAPRAQSSVLLADIDEALRKAGVSLAEIDLYAVARGPGSFTGLRAGLATIKAFASVLARPVAAVPTLEAVALSAGESALTFALVPAGRGEVFAQSFRVGRDAHAVALDEPAHVSPTALVSRVAQREGGVTWAGGGAQAHAALLRETAKRAGIGFVERRESDDAQSVRAGGDDVRGSSEAPAWTLARGATDYAGEIARLGLIRSLASELVRAEELRAEYVRLSDAELNERCRG